MRNEAETRTQLIVPALQGAGWGADGSVIREEFVIAPGRIEGAGRKPKPLIADYVLAFRNTKLAVVEAKSEDKYYTEGLGQAKEYARKMDVRFAFATNGHRIRQVDMATGAESDIDAYPSPEELWHRTFGAQGVWWDRFAAVAPQDRGGTMGARYYQQTAVTRVLEAIAANQQRILLTLATGTGKTVIAFQVVWKLFQARWNLSDATSGELPSRRPRVLFLADRNILADQAFNTFSSFSAFPDDALVRINPADIAKKGKVPKNGSIFFTIFDTFMTGTDPKGEPQPYFGEYPSDFFDFIIIDECHRGGARDESTWRGILEHFSPATQLGMTATPKRKNNVDTYAYFGEPVYVYSLREGINDGFLTPFRVKRVQTTLDSYVYTSDDTVLAGDIEQGKTYEEKDFNKIIEIRERERERVRLFMSMIDQSQKTLVFCADQDHALAVRDLINEVKTSASPNYCQRVTANDGPSGEQYLRDFQDNEKSLPTVLTTSKKLSTGVDARNVRNIVLMRPIRSMIEFKQIIGRGTRLFNGKFYFTVYDFVDASHHFADPEWDGEPAEPEASPGAVTRTPADAGHRVDDSDAGTVDPKPERAVVKLADGKERTIQHMVATSFWSPDGTPMSSQEFLLSLYGTLPEFFTNEDELRALWSKPDTRQQLLERLAERGFDAEVLTELQRLIEAEKSDLFDVLAYVAYAMAPMTRMERAQHAKLIVDRRFNGAQSAFLDFVLSHYVNVGVEELGKDKLVPLLKLKYGDSIQDALSQVGDDVGTVFTDFQQYLYEVG